jgi:hypothetical protein
MFRYSSNVTFIYYNDLEYGSNFIENILELPLVMDQGFARVYQINKTSFLGIVQLKDKIKYTGNTLVSLNTDDVRKEHTRVSKFDVKGLTKIQHMNQIPLDSFFFKDKEGHDFEIQQFLKKEDQLLF